MSTRRSSPSGPIDIITGTVSFDAASIPAATTADNTVAFTGAVVGDVVVVSPQANMTANCGIVGARVSAADQLTIRMINPTAGAVDPAVVTLNVALIRN